MTETQGDYVGCLIVLIGIVPLLIAIHHAARRRRRLVTQWIAVSVAMSVVGVAVVVLT